MTDAVDDVASIKEDTAPNPITGNVLTNDSDANGYSLSVTNAGTFGLDHGILVIHADGTYTYTLDNSNPVVNALNAGQSLINTFSYNVSNGHGDTASATLRITINGTTDNTAPVPTADVNSITEDTAPNAITGNVLTNDSDADGNALSVTNAGTFNLDHGTLIIHTDGTYTYTLDNSNPAVNALNAGQSLTNTFNYNISDGHGGTSSSTLTITINGTTDNNPPVATADTDSIKEDTSPNAITGNVLTNDSDADGNTISVTNAGTFSLDHGTLVIHTDGTYTYTLDNSNPAVNALNAGQSLTNTFNYSISDGHGGTASSTLTITINGTTDNSPPVTTADTNSVKEDTAPNPITGNVLTNDSDVDGDTLSVTNAGTFSLTYGSLTIDANGTYSYTLDNSNPAVSALDTGQSLTDTFTYNVSDGHGGTTSSSLTVSVFGTSANLAPVNSVPGTQSMLRNNELIFSAATGNAVVISDADAGTAEMDVTLSATNGMMTLSQTTGLTFSTGDGTADSVVTFTGTIADINAALEGLAFSSGTVGAAGISITTSDLGNSGTGGALVDVDTITIDVATNVIRGGSQGDMLTGTDQNDDLRGLGGNDRIIGAKGDDTIRGGAGNDWLRGGNGADTMAGGGGDDMIGGGRGNDIILGGAGNDRLRGADGADILTGGKGADTFLFRRAEHSNPSEFDRITDFSPQEGDRIDLHVIDANENRSGNQAFSFIGTDAFSGKAGELRFEQSGSSTFVYGDTDGDGAADLVIELSTLVTLREKHFDF